MRTEASAAAERECLVPVLIEDVEIPLEFRQIQSATLIGWNGDVADPEFVRLLESIGQLLGRAAVTPVPQAMPLALVSRGEPWWRKNKLALPGALVVALIAAIIFVINGLRTGERTEPESIAVTREANRKAADASGAGSSGESKTPNPGVTGAFSIAIGDRIDAGIPGPGAGNIETPYNQDVYVFAARADQRVYLRRLAHSPSLASVRWKLTDANDMEIFNTCLGCNEPGVQRLSAGGTYTLTVGSDNDPATGTYELRLFEVPSPSQFVIKIGDAIREGIPGAGAGTIESPGAEDVYSFTATPGQRVYFRRLEHSSGSSYIRMRLTDADEMEIFNTCLGCGEPGVQTLTKGGPYTLSVGNPVDASTGTYRLRLFNVPLPDRFTIKLDMKIARGVPGSGAGLIESPGAEDLYSFVASPGQEVSFRLTDHDQSMSYNQLRLIDDDGMEIFKRCFGCSPPGVQRLTRGGQYTLIVGNTTEPSTGAYALEIGLR